MTDPFNLIVGGMVVTIVIAVVVPLVFPNDPAPPRKPPEGKER